MQGILVQLDDWPAMSSRHRQAIDMLNALPGHVEYEWIARYWTEVAFAVASDPLGSANVSRNTLHNCRVLTARANEEGELVPLNDIVGTTKISDCFHTDP